MCGLRAWDHSRAFYKSILYHAGGLPHFDSLIKFGINSLVNKHVYDLKDLMNVWFCSGSAWLQIVLNKYSFIMCMALIFLNLYVFYDMYGFDLHLFRVTHMGYSMQSL